MPKTGGVRRCGGDGGTETRSMRGADANPAGAEK